MTQPPTQPRGSSADIAWLDSRIKELEAENEALRELLYAEGWGDTSIDKAILEEGNEANS